MPRYPPLSLKKSIPPHPPRPPMISFARQRSNTTTTLASCISLACSPPAIHLIHRLDIYRQPEPEQVPVPSKCCVLHFHVCSPCFAAFVLVLLLLASTYIHLQSTFLLCTALHTPPTTIPILRPKIFSCLLRLDVVYRRHFPSTLDSCLQSLFQLPLHMREIGRQREFVD